MIERILLNIETDDEYAEYVLLTSALTNKRVVPMLRPSPAELGAVHDSHTAIIRCFDSPSLKHGVYYGYNTIGIPTQFYLTKDGAINSTRVEIAHQQIEKILLDLLEDSDNLLQVYRFHFRRLWEHREQIYAKPELYFARCGLKTRFGGLVPLGAMLKAIDEHPKDFRVPVSEWHPCGVDQLIIDFQYDKTDEDGKWKWNIHRWCPVCNLVTFELRTGEKRKEKYHLSRLVKRTMAKYDKGQGLSALTVLDVLDRLND